MGVLNVTPDSFSDGGEHFGTERAVARGLEMVAQGADVIDVGGESTRPGADPVDPIAEQERVVPVIEQLVARIRAEAGSTGRIARVSIDTRHAETAVAAIEAGADLINDVSADLWPVAAEHGVGWVAMHMLGDPRTMQDSPTYVDVVAEVRDFLVERADAASRGGVAEVWIDPGIGFGKTTRHNLELLARLGELVASGYPVLVGTSRKRFLGELTQLSDERRPYTGDGGSSASAVSVPVTDRLEASVASAMWAMDMGAAMVRVHDVVETVQAVGVLRGDIPDQPDPLASGAR